MQVQDFQEAIEKIKTFLPQYLAEQGVDTTKKFKCLYPDHNDSTPSSNIVGDVAPRFYCHGCGRSGDIFDAVLLLEKKVAVGKEWVEDTLKYLASKYGVEVHSKELSEHELYELDTYRAYRAASNLLKPNITIKENKTLHEELKKRGWTTETLAAEGIGTVTSYDDFYNALVTQGFSKKFLVEVDLNRKDLFNPDNMIFAWRDEHNRVIGFTARNMNYESEKAEAEKNGEKYNGKKYNNQRTTGLKCNIFQKGRRLYGINRAVAATPPLYIFEGQADVTTAHAQGLLNCVAIAGSSMHEDHITLLKQLGIYDVVLCLDGDETGQRKLAEILETKFAGQRDMKVRVVIMPPTEDPDSFIRKNGIKAFKELAHWSAFEWRLNQYEETADEASICQQMIPFIVNEPSPVVRDKLARTLSKRTGVTLKAITDELNIKLDEKAHQRSTERREVVDLVMNELRRHPENAEQILQSAQSNLQDLVRRHSSDTLSNEDFIRSLDEQKVTEEKAAIGAVCFSLGKDLKELEEILRGDWSEGVFICIGGKPNVGKTAFLSKLSLSIAENNPDVVVIYHTIDDTAEQLVPRFITIADGSKKLSINMVRQPQYWSQTVGIPGIVEKRDKGYSRVRKLAQEGRFIIKDLNHGGSLPFAENLIKYYQEKYPDRRVVYVLDNFHKLRDFEGKDERVRFKALSEAVKSISIRRRCCILSTVEYTKLAPGIKPTNHNIGESGQIEYDANAIIHLYAEVSDIPDSFTVCHEGTDWQGNKKYLPRVEFIVGKNKISEQKSSFFLDFWPASSDYSYVDQDTVLQESKEMKAGRRNGDIVSPGKAMQNSFKSDDELNEVY